MENVIAHLPIFGPPSRVSLEGDPDWTLMLDVLAGINERHGHGLGVLVETSAGERWEHRPSDEC